MLSYKINNNFSIHLNLNLDNLETNYSIKHRVSVLFFNIINFSNLHPVFSAMKNKDTNKQSSYCLDTTIMLKLSF